MLKSFLDAEIFFENMLEKKCLCKAVT